MRTPHVLKDRSDFAVVDEDVRAHLTGLLRSGAFDASPRNRRFLSYIVEETLAGRADRLKAYTIAVATFGRGEDFDPLTDPIVRIEAARLRRSLDRYYLTAGKDDRLRIEMPKGSYVAVFICVDRAPPAAVPANTDDPIEPAPLSMTKSTARIPGRWWRLVGAFSAVALASMALTFYGGAEYRQRAAAAVSAPRLPALVIQPFEALNGDPKGAAVALSLTYEMTVVLTQMPNVAVFGPPAGSGGEADGRQVKFDYTFMGVVQGEEDGMRVSAFVVDARTGQYLRSWHFEMIPKAGSLIAAQTAIADEIRRSLETTCAAGVSSGAFDCRPALVIAAK